MALTDTANITAAYSDPNFLNTIKKNVTNTTGGKKDEGKVESLRYPLKMIDGSTDYLLMKIYEYNAPGLQGYQEIINSIVDTKQKVNSPADKNKEESTTLDVNLEKVVGGLKNKQGKTKLSKTPKSQIILPIPGALSDNNSVGWGPDSLDPLSMFGTSLASDIMSGGNPAEALGKIQDSVKNITGISQDAKDAIIAALAASAVNTLGGNVSASGLISRATGQVFNPNLELLFEGPNLRAFPFTFDFAPRNKAEGEVVKQIIRTLKIAMSGRRGGSDGVFIKAPNVFEVEYRKGGSKHPFLNSFLPMALTDISLNYTGSGTYATYHDGTPVHIQMTLTFKELDPVYAEDYDGTPVHMQMSLSFQELNPLYAEDYEDSKEKKAPGGVGY